MMRWKRWETVSWENFIDAIISKEDNATGNAVHSFLGLGARKRVNKFHVTNPHVS